MMVFLKEIFEEVDFEKNSRRQKTCKINSYWLRQSQSAHLQNPRDLEKACLTVK